MHVTGPAAKVHVDGRGWKLYQRDRKCGVTSRDRAVCTTGPINVGEGAGGGMR